jgi:hypothetical protein
VSAQASSAGGSRKELNESVEVGGKDLFTRRSLGFPLVAMDFGGQSYYEGIRAKIKDQDI